MATYGLFDSTYSAVAASRAVEAGVDLFLYSPYAWEAFTQSYRGRTPKRVLFQYHPHFATERRVLSEDSRRYPGIGESFAGTPLGQPRERSTHRERDVWQFADTILCASSFTRQSLVTAGADPEACHVVPYGIDTSPTKHAQSETPRSFEVLFVGSGGQRKGLHHLLLAWRRADLPSTSRLTLVCRVIDDGVLRMLRETPRVELFSGLSAPELLERYRRSCLFTMPSLIEGFGQVYLEALAGGCPVLGTLNTALPDLGSADDGIFCVPAGDEDSLTDMLERLCRSLPGNESVRDAARACARRFPWSRFREGIRDALTARSS